MQISSAIRLSSSTQEAVVESAGILQHVQVPRRTDGQGLAINGGEFLMLALAACYTNDLYREARRLGVEIESVDVEASAEFEGIGLAAHSIVYSARVKSSASAAAIAALLRGTDDVAEVQNTLRAGSAVTLTPWDA